MLMLCCSLPYLGRKFGSEVRCTFPVSRIRPLPNSRGRNKIKQIIYQLCLILLRDTFERLSFKIVCVKFRLRTWISDSNGSFSFGYLQMWLLHKFVMQFDECFMGGFLCRRFERRSFQLRDTARGFCRRRRRRRRRCCRLSISRRSNIS